MAAAAHQRLSGGDCLARGRDQPLQPRRAHSHDRQHVSSRAIASSGRLLPNTGYQRKQNRVAGGRLLSEAQRLKNTLADSLSQMVIEALVSPGVDMLHCRFGSVALADQRQQRQRRAKQRQMSDEFPSAHRRYGYGYERSRRRF